MSTARATEPVALATRSSPSPWTSVTTTFAPSAVNRSAHAAPIPPAGPVMTPTLSRRFPRAAAALESGIVIEQVHEPVDGAVVVRPHERLEHLADRQLVDPLVGHRGVLLVVITAEGYARPGEDHRGAVGVTARNTTRDATPA